MQFRAWHQESMSPLGPRCRPAVSRLCSSTWTTMPTYWPHASVRFEIFPAGRQSTRHERMGHHGQAESAVGLWILLAESEVHIRRSNLDMNRQMIWACLHVITVPEKGTGTDRAGRGRGPWNGTRVTLRPCTYPGCKVGGVTSDIT